MGRFHETSFGVYFDDLDPFQILHNARYLLLFERAIGEFWSEHFGWPPLLDQDANPDQYHMVRANSIEYLKPVRGMGSVRVRLTVKRLGTSSVTFAARFLPPDQDTDCAVGQRTLVKVDPNTHRPAPWTDAFRETVAPFVQ